jgi:hypothetical protein
MFKKWVSSSVVVGALLGAAVAPGVAVAAPNASASPNVTDLKNAARQCRAERGATSESRNAFKVKYGTNANGSNAFGRCVSVRARATASLRQAATAACLDERGRSRVSRDTFELKYGAAGNALRVCVAVRMVPVAGS